MITVEELIVQSLYHKVVLVNVKRAPTRTPTGGTMDGLGLFITGAQRMRNAMARQGTLPTGHSATPPGKEDTDIDEETVSIDYPMTTPFPDQVPDWRNAQGAVANHGAPSTSMANHNHTASMAVANHSAGAMAMANSGQVSLDGNEAMETILDTGEFQLVRMAGDQMPSGEQRSPSMPPMWLLGETDSGHPTFRQTSLEAIEPGQESTSTGEVMVKQPGEVVRSEQGACQPAVNLSSFDNFSIVHYQDKREPHKSLVMIQTPKKNNLHRVDELANGEEQEALTYEEKLGLTYEEKLALTYEEKLALTYEEKLMIENGDKAGADNTGDGRASALQRRHFQFSRGDSLEAQLFPDENGDVMTSSADLDMYRQQEAKEMICMLPMHFPPEVESMIGEHEMDSGVWDMVTGRDSQGSGPDASSMQAQVSSVQQEACSSIDLALQDYVPDVEPVMSYRVYQINNEVVLNSEGEQNIPMVETITERKALPVSSSTPAVRKAQRKRGKGRSRKRKNKGRRSAAKDRPPGRTGSLGESSAATDNSSSYDHTPDRTYDEHVALTSQLLAAGNLSHSHTNLYQRQPSPSRIETTFTVDNDITCGSDDSAFSVEPFSPPGKVVHRPLQRGFKSGISQGLNLVQGHGGARSKSTGSAPPRSIISKYCSMSQSDLSSPMSGEVLFSPTSDDSNCTMYSAQSVASWEAASKRASLSVGQTEAPGYRGPFLSVPNKRSSAYSDSSGDMSEYESAEDQSMTEAVNLDDLLFVNHADWMSELPKRLHAVPLSGLAIPGSNISLAIETDMRLDMSFTKCNLEMADFLRKLPPLAVFDNFRHLMKDIWKAWMVKQILSVNQQLEAGVRYFDFRLTKFRGAIYGEHGLYTKQLRKYLKEMEVFLKEHPKEVIIMHFQSFENIDHKDKRALVTTLFQVFGARLCRVTRVAKLTLEELWSSRKQVLAIFPDDDIEDLKNHIFSGLIWSNKIVRSSQPKKQKAMDLVRYLDCIYDETRDEDTLHITEAVLSPNMQMVFGDYKYKSMREMTLSETSPALKQWLLGKSDLNIVSVDFVGCLDLTGSIIALNELKKAETVV